MPPPSPFELLNFLFATVARKPPAVPFRQGAAVARYLDDLVYELEPGPERELVFFLFKVVWGKVFQYSKFKTATKEEAVQFLEKFALTHLATYDIDSALKTVSAAASPKAHVHPSVLRAPALSVTQGLGMKRYQDDLSERICAGYWALRFARVRGAREHVAGALKHHGIQTHSRKGDTTWTGSDVWERVKQYEARFFGREKQKIRDRRLTLTEKWSNKLYYPINWTKPLYKPEESSGSGRKRRPRKGSAES